MQKRSLFYGGILRPLGAQSAQITSTIYKTQNFVFKSALPVASAMAPESLVPVGEYKRPDAKKDVPPALRARIYDGYPNSDNELVL